MRDSISLQTILNTFECALNGQKISDGANPTNKSSTVPLFQFFDWILDLISGNEHSNIAEKNSDASKCLLLIDGHNMVHQLLNASTDANGNLVGECKFRIGHGFILTQHHGQLVLRDEKNPAVIKELSGVSFNQLKSTILRAYIKETGDHISDFDGDHNFQGVDFAGFRATPNDLATMVRCRANLTDTILLKPSGEEASASDFNKFIKKILALQLIQAGANPKSVLTHYLIAQRELNENLFKSGDAESIDSIDIDGFDLTGLDLGDMAYADENTGGDVGLHLACRDVDAVIKKIAESQPKKTELHQPVESEVSVDDLP